MRRRRRERRAAFEACQETPNVCLVILSEAKNPAPKTLRFAQGDSTEGFVAHSPSRSSPSHEYQLQMLELPQFASPPTPEFCRTRAATATNLDIYVTVLGGYEKGGTPWRFG